MDILAGFQVTEITLHWPVKEQFASLPYRTPQYVNYLFVKNTDILNEKIISEKLPVY